MADPLSISASIAALLQVTSSVTAYLRNVKDASNDCNKLFVEISFTRGILDTLKDTIVNVADSDSSSWATTLQIIVDPGGPLETLQSLMLELEVKLEKTTSARGVKGLARRVVWPFTSKETVAKIKLVERQKTLLTLALQNDHLLLSREIKKYSEAIEADVKDVVRGVGVLEMGQRDSLTEKVLSWLSPLNFQATQKDVFRRRNGNSGSWFLRKSEFQDWLAGSQDVLFCPGIPGAGKTVLASLVIDHLLSKFPLGNDVPVATVWIYCSYKERKAQTTDHFLGSIVSQLVQQKPGLLNDVVELYQKHSSIKEAPPDPADILELLERKIRCYHTVFVVIDALDECDDEDKSGLRLADALRRLQPNVRLLITSRPLPNIVEEFEDVPQVEIRALDTDIRDFVRSRLEVEPRLKKHIQADAKFGELVEDAVAEKSDGMFLMAKLHMDALVKWAKYSKMAVRRALDELPKELDTTYDQAWQRIHDQNADDACLAQQVLSWICLAYEPLNVLALQQGLAVQRGDPAFDTDCLIEATLIISVCAGLVVLDQESQLVRLVHYTTQDYFQRRLLEYLPETSIQISTACLGHLLDTPIPEWDPDGVDRYFLEDDQSYDRRNKLYNQKIFKRFFMERQITAYASDHLVKHVQRTPDSSLWEPVKRLWQSSPREHLYHAYKIFRDAEETDAMECYLELNESQLAVFLGFQDEVVRMLGSIDLVTAEESVTRPLLCIAASQGHDTIITLLLDAGAKADAVMQTTLYDGPLTALDCAIRGAHVATIKLLATRCPDLLHAHLDQRQRNALHLAAELKSPLVIEALISCGAAVDAKDNDGMTPLHIAADAPRGQDRKPIVRALVDAGAHVNASDHLGRTALIHACRRNNIEAVDALIVRGADVNGKGEGYEPESERDRANSPLWYAVHNYNADMVRLLLEKGAIVRTQVGGVWDRFPMPVLYREEIQQLLGEYGDGSLIFEEEGFSDDEFGILSTPP